MLAKIIKFSITHKVVVGLLTLMLIIWGLWSAFRLPIDAVPDITNNQVQIMTTCPTLAGQEVEQLVTFPINSASPMCRVWRKSGAFPGSVFRWLRWYLGKMWIFTLPDN